MILIISSPDDAHIPYVTRHLRQDFVVIDAGTIVEHDGLSYRVSPSGTLTIFAAGKRLENITGIWVRKPRIPGRDLKLPVTKSYHDYTASALNECIKQLYAVLPDKNWVSDMYAIERAETKVCQLMAARRAGFFIPETLVTSSEGLARSFISMRSECIVKALSKKFASAGKGSYLEFYATKVTPQDNIRYDGLNLAPAIFQQLIEPKVEYRVSVVGDKVFPAAMDLKNVPESRIRDWHIGYIQGEIHVRRCRLPRGVSKKCVRLVKALGLKFGAIDLIQDKQGRTWFIEINSNGQWAFVEEETGQPIGAAIAALLEGR